MANHKIRKYTFFTRICSLHGLQGPSKDYWSFYTTAWCHYVRRYVCLIHAAKIGFYVHVRSFWLLKCKLTLCTLGAICNWRLAWFVGLIVYWVCRGIDPEGLFQAKPTHGLALVVSLMSPENVKILTKCTMYSFWAKWITTLTPVHNFLVLVLR
jgi:hypothetical protein